SVTENFTAAALRQNLDMLREPEHRRLLLHAILGVLIVITPLVLGLWVRISRTQRLIPLLLTAAAVVAIGLQVWFGITILYDGHEGPPFSFNSGTAAAGEHHEHEHGAREAEPATVPATAPATR